MRIINLSDRSLETGWQSQLQNAIRDPKDLAETLCIDVEAIDSEFPLLVPEPFLNRMEVGNPRDPLLLQVLPVAAELLDRVGYSKDPVSEQSKDGIRGLIQKYRGRALIVATGTCAVNCRYCFRRHYPYHLARLSQEDWRALFRHLKQDSSISEVILSGGDPLMLNDRTLASVFESLNQIPQIKTIRVHTRLPVVIPSRVTKELLSMVETSQKKVVFVTHINHPNELDEALTFSLQTLRTGGATLLNQSVLLREVNDQADTLAELSRKLFAASVLPYYLHLLDPVQGAGHFDVEELRGKALINKISSELPGYLVPKLAREVAGAPAKKVLIG